MAIICLQMKVYEIDSLAELIVIDLKKYLNINSLIQLLHCKYYNKREEENINTHSMKETAQCWLISSQNWKLNQVLKVNVEWPAPSMIQGFLKLSRLSLLPSLTPELNSLSILKPQRNSLCILKQASEGFIVYCYTVHRVSPPKADMAISAFVLLCQALTCTR